MQIMLSEIENIKPISSSARVKDFRPLYALLCGIECEYAINILKKNKDDSLIKYIASYFLTQDVSAKTLFKECMPTDPEMAELHSLLKFNEQEPDDYIKILNSIQWTNDNGENLFFIGDFSFKSKITFVDLKLYQGKFFALELKRTGNGNEFTALGLKKCPDELKHQTLIDLCTLLTTQDMEIEQLKTVSACNLSDDEFFQLTTKLKEMDEEQKSAIRATTEKNLLIIAGAGSGKTRSLVGRLTYLHLVKGIPLNKLLLLTFTRAATQEMGGSALQEIKEAYMSKISKAEKNPYVMANTIDGFFKQLIERYYLDVGLTEEPSFLLDNNDMKERLGLQALSDKLGYNFKTEIVHNLQRLMQLYMQDKIGAKAKPYKTDSISAKKITKDIRTIAKAKCKAGIPGQGFLMDLLTCESKHNNELESCKSLVVQCYIVCSGKYRISEIISDSWKFKKFQYPNPEGFIVAALDLTNIRNVMIHEGNEIWTTDYLPYAFNCLELVMKYFS